MLLFFLFCTEYSLGCFFFVVERPPPPPPREALEAVLNRSLVKKGVAWILSGVSDVVSLLRRLWGVMIAFATDADTDAGTVISGDTVAPPSRVTGV